MRAFLLIVILTIMLVVGCTSGAPAASSKATDASKSAASSGSEAKGTSSQQKSSESSKAAKPKDLVQVQFGLTSDASYFVPIYVADKKGFFAQEGLKVDYVRIGNNENIAALTSGSIPIGIPSTEPSIRALMKGAKIKLVANLLETAPYDLVSQSNIKSPEQARGGTIGVGTLTGATATVVKKFFDAYGMIEGRDYTLIAPGSNMDRIAALVSRSVQVVLLSDPATFEALAKGYNYLGSISERVPHYSFMSFWVNEDWANRNEDKAVGFLKASIRGMDWMYDPANKDEAIKIIGDYFNLTPQVAKQTYELHVEKVKSWTPRLAISEKAIQGAMDLNVELGLMKREEIPSLEKLGDPRFYQRALQELGK